MPAYAELSDEQLTHRMFDVERELVAARFQHSLGQLDNTAGLRNLRREIAQIRTAARQRELVNGLGKGALIRQHRKTWGSKAAGQAEEAQEEKGGFLKGIVDKLTGND